MPQERGILYKMSKKTTQKKKKRSQAPIALVYFAALCVCLVVVGALVLTVFRRFDILSLGKNDSQAYEGYTSNDCTTILFARINSKNVLHDMLIYRLDPTKDKIFLVPVTPYMLDESTGKTLKQTLDGGDMEQLTAAVSRCLGIDIPYYMTVSNGSFDNICDQLGGYTYTAPEDLFYLSGDMDSEKNDVTIQKGSTLNLMGRQIRLIMTYPVFSEGRQGNVRFTASAFETMVASAFALPDLTKNNLDVIYKLAKKKSDTNYTDDNYKIMKTVLVEMLGRGVSPAMSITPSGTWSADDSQFVVDASFKDELEKQFTPEVMANKKDDSSK